MSKLGNQSANKHIHEILSYIFQRCKVNDDCPNGCCQGIGNFLWCNDYSKEGEICSITVNKSKIVITPPFIYVINSESLAHFWTCLFLLYIEFLFYLYSAPVIFLMKCVLLLLLIWISIFLSSRVDSCADVPQDWFANDTDHGTLRDAWKHQPPNLPNPQNQLNPQSPLKVPPRCPLSNKFSSVRPPTHSVEIPYL